MYRVLQPDAQIAGAGAKSKLLRAPATVREHYFPHSTIQKKSPAFVGGAVRISRSTAAAAGLAVAAV
jgi:hypothetical protein